MSSPAYEFDDVLNIKTSFNKRAAAEYNNYSLGMETGMSKPANARKCLLIHLPIFKVPILNCALAGKMLIYLNSKEGKVGLTTYAYDFKSINFESVKLFFAV